MDKQAFIAAVKAAGIVGEGGAGFPAHVKYAADADTVIANGCECEPLLHTDQHHMLHHANEIVRAFSELMQATGAKRGVIALKKKYKEATKDPDRCHRQSAHRAGAAPQLLSRRG